MSELHQSGLHPDADQLNAFVEHALPSHEREQTLAHLAGCAQCRSIVSLSLPPAAEAAHPQAELAHRPWFRGWNLAWPVAVAFAALVPLVLYIHKTETTRSRTAAPTEIAESRPAPPPLAPPASAPLLSPKLPSPHVTVEKSPGPPAATASPSGKRPEPAAPPPPAFAQIVPGAAVVGAAAAPPNPPTGAPQPPAASAGAARFSAGLGGSGGSRPATAPGNSGIYSGTGQANLNKNYTEGVPVAPALATPQPAAAAVTVTGASMQVVTSADAPQLNAADSSMAQLQLKNLALPAPLPSGLPTLSTASRGRLALALDTANTLFISNDGGRRWAPVLTQWKGRAVSVKLATVPAAPARGTAQAAGGGLAGFAAGALVGAPRQNSGVNSEVAGIVTDPTGAIVPNATVAVIDAAGQAVRNTQTGPDGRYRIDGLAPGNYHLQARAPGFQTLDLPITLAASQQSLANLTLQVGAATESVTVTAAPATALDEASTAQAAKSQMKAAPAGPLQPAPLFEITTESGERWTSPDGQTWTRRP